MASRFGKVFTITWNEKMIVVFDKTSGRIEKLVSAPDDHLVFYGEEAFVSNEPVSDTTHYVQNGEFIPFPAKPSTHHTWDWPTKSWLPDLPSAIAARKKEIDRERDRRINLPLTYDGKVLDADMTARDNLKAKLEEVRERIRLNMPMAPELLVWRDNSNQTHSWLTIDAYHDWLAGYAVAMSDRGTRCYACAWHHKDALKAANDPNGQPWTVETVQSYSLTQGWPA